MTTVLTVDQKGIKREHQVRDDGTYSYYIKVGNFWWKQSVYWWKRSVYGKEVST
jgi:hypothetical protein